MSEIEPYLVTCRCGERFNPLMPMALYGNDFHVDGVQCCPDCTKALLDAPTQETQK